MRRMIAATLVLIPVMAHAQASTTAEPKVSQASATLVAKATPPAPFGAAKGADTTISVRPNLVHEIVSTTVDPYFPNEALREGGAVSYTLLGDNDNTAIAPRLIHVVNIQLSQDQLVAASDVTIHLTVDALGVPHNLKINRSANEVIDEKTLEAVSQYRFTPAKVNYLPTEADVTVEVKIQK
jgi:TonB family protein